MQDQGKEITAARARLDGMLSAAGLPRRASYNRAEVCRVLHISERTFWRYSAHHEVEPATGLGLRPWTLDSYMTRGHYRIRYDELADWLRRNRSYERNCSVDSRQLVLPGF